MQVRQGLLFARTVLSTGALKGRGRATHGGAILRVLLDGFVLSLIVSASKLVNDPFWDAKLVVASRDARILTWDPAREDCLLCMSMRMPLPYVHAHVIAVYVHAYVFAF